MNHDHLCHDKTGRQIQPGDLVRIHTIDSLCGTYPIERGPDSELYFVVTYQFPDEKQAFISRQLLAGFYPSTMQVVDSEGTEQTEGQG